MAYKSILVHVDKCANAEQRYSVAAAIAENEEAHLLGAAMSGISRFIHLSEIGVPESYGEALPKTPVALLRERAADALKNFERIAQTKCKQFEKRLMEDEACGGITLLARYSDLVVVGQVDRDDPFSAFVSDLPEYVALASGRPVMVIPRVGQFASVGSRILIAWDGSISATRTISAAMPLLTRAEIVEVVVFNPRSKPDIHGEEPGADIALYLARHGVKVDVLCKETSADIGSALLDTASSQSSNLLVMGCYGHTRFQEILLGGATRTVLQMATIPVLMAH